MKRLTNKIENLETNPQKVSCSIPKIILQCNCKKMFTSITGARSIGWPYGNERHEWVMRR